jgi:hypothetical protein
VDLAVLKTIIALERARAGVPRRLQAQADLLLMVEVARPAFIAQGLAEDACFSDAFVPAARKPV